MSAGSRKKALRKALIREEALKREDRGDSESNIDEAFFEPDDGSVPDAAEPPR